MVKKFKQNVAKNYDEISVVQLRVRKYIVKEIKFSIFLDFFSEDSSPCRKRFIISSAFWSLSRLKKNLKPEWRRLTLSYQFNYEKA